MLFAAMRLPLPRIYSQGYGPTAVQQAKREETQRAGFDESARIFPVKAFRVYRFFYGLLLLAFFIVAHVEAWQAVHAKPEGFSPDVLAATLNGCLSFAGKAFLSPLGLTSTWLHCQPITEHSLR